MWLRRKLKKYRDSCVSVLTLGAFSIGLGWSDVSHTGYLIMAYAKIMSKFTADKGTLDKGAPCKHAY